MEIKASDVIDNVIWSVIIIYVKKFKLLNFNQPRGQK